MHKRTLLLATTALAATQLSLTPVARAETWEMNVGGFMSQYFGYADGTSNADDGFDQQTDAEIEFTPSITLDNGLKLGANVQLEAQTDADQIDQQFAYIEGSFGRIELGSTDNAPAAMSIGVPSAGIGLDDGDSGNWIGGINTDLVVTTPAFAIDEDSAQKLTYYTPRFSGVQAGASYVPESAEDADAPPNNANGVRDDAFGVAANYHQDFNDVSFDASAGYMHYGDDKAAAGSAPENYGFGVSLGYAGFTLSGTYNRLKDSSSGNLENVGLGLVYEAGSFASSLGYIQGDDKSSSAKSDAFELGASYALSPGVAAVFSFYYVDQTTSVGSNLEGTAGVGGLALTF